MTDLSLHFRRAHKPPSNEPTAEWAERVIRLPATASAVPGPLQLWPQQRGILHAIDDPKVWRVSFLKSARVGATLLQSIVMLNYVDNRPSPILFLQPRETDAREHSVELENLCDASPLIASSIRADRARRDTMFRRHLPGGTLHISAAMSPANFRRIAAKLLLADEIVAYAPTDEGPALDLAIKRTETYLDRLIFAASTPGEDDVCPITASYNLSDQRVYELACVECGSLFEPTWQHIKWSNRDPATAQLQCPHCETLLDERHKRRMVELGGWRITKPDRTPVGHIGFRLNSLSSFSANATWPQLVAEFLQARGDSQAMKVFTTTTLGQPWRVQAEELDPDHLKTLVEPVDLDPVPSDVRWLTAGVDVQIDRLELIVTGWTVDNKPIVLFQDQFWGSPHDKQTWSALDDTLKLRWPHELGGTIGLDAVGIDAGDGNTMQDVLAFTQPRRTRRIFALKGIDGNHPATKQSRTANKKLLIIVGVDGLKSRLHGRIADKSITFSDQLDDRFYEELASESRQVRYKRGTPVYQWIRRASVRAESLDCVVYSMAVRELVRGDPNTREAELREAPEAAPRPPRVVRSRFMEGRRL